MLILGGSSDATALSRGLAGHPAVAALLSLAGRTREPVAQPLPTRVGGFGGAEGLAAYLCGEAIDLLIDATHPFATRISANARAAADATGTPLLRVERPAWEPIGGDRWQEVADMDAAARSLGAVPRRVFLTIGRLRVAAFAVAPHHHYLVRTIDPAAVTRLPHVRAIAARPPFDVEGETRLLRDHRIDVLVAKNSGGSCAYAKIAAARALGLPVIMVARPAALGDTMQVGAALAVIEARVEQAHGPAQRGV